MGARRRLFLAAALAALAPWVAAQDYPARPVRIVIAYGPGSGLDTLMRQMAQELNKKPAGIAA